MIENIGRETVIKVSSWLRGIWEMRRRASPVQQWVDSLPSPVKSSDANLGSIVGQQSLSVDAESSISECPQQVFTEKKNHISHHNMTVVTPITTPSSPLITCSNISRNGATTSYRSANARLARDPSFQSDSSHCSSVESLLELRRADPEAVLLSLGFGGSPSSEQESGPLSRIPKRFLQPSRLKGIAIDDFVRHQQESCESFDSASLGYRGLTGSPYVAPSEIVQKIMQRLREHETQELEAATLSCLHHNNNNNINNNINNNHCSNSSGETYPLPPQDNSRLSVLSPDNRLYLDRPRSKSPDMRNKRMIIGQRSFAFGRDGDLIEIKPGIARSSSQESDDVFGYLGGNRDQTQSKHQHETPTVQHVHRRHRLQRRHLRSESTTSRSRSSGAGSCIRSRKHSPITHDDQTSATTSDSHICLEAVFTSTTSIAQTEDDPSDTCTNEKLHPLVDNNHNVEERCEARRYSASAADDIRRIEKQHQHELVRRSLRRNPKIEPTSSTDQHCTHCGRPDRSRRQCELEDEAAGSNEQDTSCCYGRPSGCWREMEKVLQKNKKLEDTVARSRREMAEIKEMLSSVLHVKLEPGF
ncbi:hypothetical protein QAD02_022673 [Eretmocerus hayati]|uniref:Uncharacterized protein n=1 Tax=Eretmocerus hayati TaxID=131215 RepID=A0ACC2PUB3_9HYME|nr:hypothetical protein QAD02_022673 [Eretmocerus hayati]